MADVSGGSKPIRQNDLTDLVVESEIETADVEVQIRERFSANAVFKLKRIAFFQVAIHHTACAGGNQFAVGPGPVSLRHGAVKFHTRRAAGRDDRSGWVFSYCAFFSCDRRRGDGFVAFPYAITPRQAQPR